MQQRPTNAQRTAVKVAENQQFALGFAQRQAETAALARRVLSAQIAGFVVGGVVARAIGRRR